MNIRWYSLLVALLSTTTLTFSQSTFQKVLPDLQPTWGDCTRRSPTGGLIFSSWTQEQFGSSGSDIALLSFNVQGDTLWTKVYSRPFNDACFHLLTTVDGGYLLTGYTNTDGTASSTSSIYLIRTDVMGDTLWTRAYGRGANNIGASAIECDDGGFLVAGSWGGAYNDGLYILRLNAQGDLMWTRRYDHLIMPDLESSVSVRSLAQAPNGDFFLAGDRAGYPGVFLARLNPAGDLIWAKSTFDFDYIEQLESTPDGELVLSGNYDSNPLLVRLDSGGAPLWAKAYDGVAVGWGATAFAQTSDHGVAMIAQTIDIDPGSSNAYFLKTDATGNVQFSKTFGDTLWDAGRGVIEATDGGYFILAWSQSFGFGSAVYLIKTDSIGTSGCNEYEDTTVAVNVEILWDTLVLDPYWSSTDQYPSACSIRSGTTLLPLCWVGEAEAPAVAPNMRVAPNPASDGCNISIPSNCDRVRIELFNPLGELVLDLQAVRSETWINRGTLASGVYLVKVTQGSTSAFLRVVFD